MIVRLLYKGKGQAQVVCPDESQTKTYNFQSIDEACDYLATALLINEDDIDDAVIKMHAHKHVVAIFDNGKLESTRFY